MRISINHLFLILTSSKPIHSGQKFGSLGRIFVLLLCPEDSHYLWLCNPPKPVWKRWFGRSLCGDSIHRFRLLQGARMWLTRRSYARKAICYIRYRTGATTRGTGSCVVSSADSLSVRKESRCSAPGPWLRDLHPHAARDPAMERPHKVGRIPALSRLRVCAHGTKSAIAYENTAPSWSGAIRDYWTRTCLCAHRGDRVSTSIGPKRHAFRARPLPRAGRKSKDPWRVPGGR